MVWEIMARQLPYWNEDVDWVDWDDLEEKICRQQNPVRPRPVLPEQQLPDNAAACVTEIITKCWQTKPSKRPEKFHDIEEKLQDMLDHDVAALTDAQQIRLNRELRKLADLP